MAQALLRILASLVKGDEQDVVRSWKSTMIISKNEARAERILRRAWSRMLIRASMGCVRRFNEHWKEAMSHQAAERILKRVWGRMMKGAQVSCVHNWNDKAFFETRRLKRASMTILSRPMVWAFEDWTSNYSDYCAQKKAEATYP